MQSLETMLMANARHAQPLRDQTHRERVNGPLQFHKRSEYLFGAHDETLSVAMRVHNPNRSALKIES